MNMQDFARTGVALANYLYGVAKEVNDRSARVARIMNRGEIALNIEVLLGGESPLDYPLPDERLTFAMILSVGHLTVGLWVEAILVAAKAKVITNNGELEKFKTSLNSGDAWTFKRRGNEVVSRLRSLCR